MEKLSNNWSSVSFFPDYRVFFGHKGMLPNRMQTGVFSHMPQSNKQIQTIYTAVSFFFPWVLVENLGRQEP